jgi:hypothetical protein
MQAWYLGASGPDKRERSVAADPGVFEPVVVYCGVGAHDHRDGGRADEVETRR